MPTQKVHHPPLAAHVLLQPQPLQDLSRIAIKDMGKVQRRNARPVNNSVSSSTMSNAAGHSSNAASNAASHAASNTSSTLMSGNSGNSGDNRYNGDNGALREDRAKGLRGESNVRPDALTIFFLVRVCA